MFQVAAFAAVCLALGARAFAAQTASLRIQSGSGQTAPAYASVRAARYETRFTQSLRVGVKGTDEDVRFTCLTPECEFVAADQADPDAVNRVNKRTYDVKQKNGTASLNIIASTLHPAQRLDVLARPANDEHARGVHFILTTR